MTAPANTMVSPVSTPDQRAAEAQRFFDVLYPNADQHQHYIRALLTLPGARPAFLKANDHRGAAEIVSRGTQNEYHTVCLLAREPASGRGAAEDAVVVPAVWIDYDAHHPQAHKGEGLSPKEEVLTRLRSHPLRPTVIVDSGYGYQAYWSLREPLVIRSDEDREQAKALVAGFTAGCQELWGAGVDSAGDLARVLRIPGSLNHKLDEHGEPPVPVRIVEVNGDARYTVGELQPYLGQVKTERSRAEPLPQVIGKLRNVTLFSFAGTLRNRGLAEEEIISTLQIINASRCTPPLDNEEVHRIARSAMRYEPGEHHEADVQGRVYLNAANADLVQVVAEAWSAVAASNAPAILFAFGGIPSRLEVNEDGRAFVRPLTVEGLRLEVAGAAQFYVPKVTAEGEVQRKLVVPPTHIVAAMLAAPNPPLPPLERIVSAPVFGPQGELQVTPGYHPASRTYYQPQPGFTLPSVSDAPTKDEVERARDLLCQELLSDFPFVSEAERAHAVAVLLLPFVRATITGPTPLHMLEANSAGTGKGLLSDVLTIPSLGEQPSVLTEARDDDEWRKRLTSCLRSAPAVVVLDNLNRTLDSGSLAAVLTANIWEDRLLGSNDTVRAPVRCLWLATANNPTMSTEIARRTVRIRLDAKVDRPWQRTDFRHADLRTWAREHRGALVWAALTLVRAWQAAGRPLGQQRLGSYERWANVIGGILQIAGIGGFLGNLERFYEEADVEGVAWRELVAEWWSTYLDQEVKAADLFYLAAEIPGFDFGKGNEKAQKTAFGMQLSKQRDRIIGEFQIVHAGEAKRAKLWKLVRTRPPGSSGQSDSEDHRLSQGEPSEPSEPFPPQRQLERLEEYEGKKVRQGSEGSPELHDDNAGKLRPSRASFEQITGTGGVHQ